MAAIDLNLLAQLSAEGMAECLVEGILLACIAALILRLANIRDAATRFAVWMSTLLTMAILPFGTAVWRLQASGATVGAGADPAAVHLPSAWAVYAFAVWALIAGAGLLRIAVGLWQVYRLRRTCVEMQPDTFRDLGPDVAQLLLDNKVQVCVADQVQAPVAVGFLRPAVVIPDWLIAELSPSQLRQVIIHEVTHLSRRDGWTNLLQKIVSAVLFFHPVVWWIERKLALDRELACDDAVLARSADARGYAECLVRLAEKTFMRRGIALAQAAVSRLRHTSLRVAQILNGQPRVGLRWKAALIAVVPVAAACVMLSMRAPVLIGFQATPPAQSEAVNEGFSKMPVHQAVFVPASAAQHKSTTVSPEPKRAAARVIAPVPRARVAPVRAVSARMQHKASDRKMALVSTESLVVLVSAPAPGQVQVQMWRITVFQQAIHPDNVPRKAI